MSDNQTTIPLLNRSVFTLLAALVLGGGLLVGCDSAGTSSDGGSEVEVGFGTTSSTSTAGAFAKADGPLVVGGTNGDTLRIDDIRFIVSEVELGGDADSAEFETEKPAFVDLPLNSSDVVSIVSDRMPPGTYNEFKFKVEDAGLDDDDDEEGIQQLQQDIADAGFPNWPSEASLVVVGSFTPSGESSQSFTTYVDAEIEVEIEMENQSFQIGGDDPSRRLTVNLSPSNWFVSNGNPMDLSADQYQNAEEPVELEIKFEEKSEIEFDD